MAEIVKNINCRGNVYVISKQMKRGESERRGKKREHSRQKPTDLPKLCRYQDRCRGECTYVHLKPEQLKGSRRPYNLCWAFPECQVPNCRYVHWRPTSDEPADKKQKVNQSEEEEEEDKGGKKE